MQRFILRFRERVNLFIYSSKETVLKVFSIISLFASVMALATLLYYYGFPQNEFSKIVQINVIKVVFGFFILHYLIRFFFSFHPVEFLMSTWFEGILMLLLMYDAASLYLFNTPLLENIFKRMGVYTFTDFYVLFIQFYMLLIVGIDLTKASVFITKINLHPSTTFIFSFILIILLGTLLLTFPEMSNTEGSMPFLDALFMSTSAVCVTGLTVVDMGTYFTFKGEVVLLILVQLGGIGIISFATFFAAFLKEGIGLKQQMIIQDLFSTESLLKTKSLLQQVIFSTLLIEFAGAFVIFLLWDPDLHFSSLGEKIFYSIFHSICAFCNAGFALFSKNLMEDHVQTSYILHLSIAVLIILGGIGFSTLRDLFGVHNLKKRLKSPWKQWELGTKVSIYTSIGLIIFGTVLYYFLEKNNTLYGLRFAESLITALFQSVTTRTAGFNTVDIGAIGTPMLIIMMFLMFVGASTGSTGGGIKTSTFFLMLASSWSTIRGIKKIEIDKKEISYDLLHKAFIILFFSGSLIVLCTFILAITDTEIPILNLVFEEMSAFATCGLSTGITPLLSDGGKITIIISMFIGRIGTLTLFFSLSIPAARYGHKYPEAHLVVG